MEPNYFLFTRAIPLSGVTTHLVSTHCEAKGRSIEIRGLPTTAPGLVDYAPLADSKLARFAAETVSPAGTMRAVEALSKPQALWSTSDVICVLQGKTFDAVVQAINARAEAPRSAR